MNSSDEFVLEVHGLCKTFRQNRWWQRRFQRRALDGISLRLRRSATLGLAGKSGCGKTTLAMCLVGLEQPDSGEIFLEGTNLQSLERYAEILTRREIQLIFQDSSGALNPRMSAIQIVEEPLLIRGQCSRREQRQLATEMMERVGISPKWAHRLPHEFSGGQRQRLAIARALVLKPKVMILDEIFVGLDLSIQGQIANLLLDLQQSHGLSYICISHNLALLSQFADEIAIMDQGQIVEHAGSQNFFERAHHSRSAPSGVRRPEPVTTRASSGASA
jgi:peptide/nickel transport system ATP-binding protein